MAKRRSNSGLQTVPLNEEHRCVLVNRRKELGLTQQQLADKLGCLQLSVSNIENGKHDPRPEMMTRLCSALGLEYQMSVFVFLRKKK